MKLRYLFATLAALATLVLCSSVFVYGQGTDLGTIRGTVTDSTGAVVTNASVTILDVSTGATRHTTTNSRGEYQMFGLRSGAYKVTITNPGMNTAEVTGIVVNGSDVVSANAVLKVAASTEQVIVTSEAPPSRRIGTSPVGCGSTIVVFEAPTLSRASLTLTSCRSMKNSPAPAFIVVGSVRC